MVLAEKPATIVALGCFKGERSDGASPDFAKYIKSGVYTYTVKNQKHTITVECEMVEHQNTFAAPKLTITDSLTGQTHTVYVNNFVVVDNHPVNLDYDAAKILLSIHDNATTEHPSLLHCASGVGRTGMIRLILKALDEINRGGPFCQLFDKLVQGEQLTLSEQTQMAQAFEQMAFSCRTVRYAMQVPEQFTLAVKNLVILRAVQLGKNPTDINTLRRQLEMPNNITPINYGIWPNADLSKPLQPTTNIAPGSASSVSGGPFGSRLEQQQDTSSIDSPQFQ